MKVFETNYARSKWPWGFQAPAGMITFGKDADGKTYMRQETDPGNPWIDGTLRADCIDAAHVASSYLVEGASVAFAWDALLEPGWYADNPGWDVVGVEIHDPSGSTQSPLELLPSQLGDQVRCFGGAIGPNGAPLNAADKYYSPEFALPIGVKHRNVLALTLSKDRTVGRVSFALDGKVLIDHHAAATLYTDGSGYLKFAHYRGNAGATHKDAVRSWDLAMFAGVLAWQEALASGAPPPPPPPAARPIHAAVEEASVVELAGMPATLQALDLIADKVEP